MSTLWIQVFEFFVSEFEASFRVRGKTSANRGNDRRLCRIRNPTTTRIQRESATLAQRESNSGRGGKKRGARESNRSRVKTAMRRDTSAQLKTQTTWNSTLHSTAFTPTHGAPAVKLYRGSAIRASGPFARGARRSRRAGALGEISSGSAAGSANKGQTRECRSFSS